MTIGEKIKKIRLDNNLNQSEFGEKVGCSKETIINYEKGVTSPKIGVLRNIIDVFNVDYTWLMGRESISSVLTNTKKSKGVKNSTNNGLVENGIIGNINNSSIVIKNGTQHTKEVTNLEDDMLECYRTLDTELQEYYYHKIKADALAQKIKNRE